MTITARYLDADNRNAEVTLEPGDHLASLSVQAPHTIPAYTIPAHTVSAFELDGVTYPARDVPAEDVAAVDAPGGETTRFTIPCDPKSPFWAELLRRVEAGEVAPIAKYVAPPEPVTDSISDRQFWQQLALDEKATPGSGVTEAEALDAVRTGAIPKKLDDAITANFDADQQFAMRMAISGAYTFELSNPATPLLGQLLGRDMDAMRALWARASKIR